MNTQIIKERMSVRTFKKQSLDEQTLTQVKKIMQEDHSLFGVPVTFQLLDPEKDHVSAPVVVDAPTYVGVKVKKQKNAELSLGYAFEYFILNVTALGLGSVWLAATIDRKAFEKAMHVQEDEMMPVVTPLGYAAEKRSVREKMMRKGLKADTRLPFEKLFFKQDFAHPLSLDEAGDYQQALEMVQLAPSATNKQPWRVVVDGDRVHFYEVKNKGYAKEDTGDIQKVDLGIALCHFEVAMHEAGKQGQFIQEDPGIILPDDHTEYIATYVKGQK